MLFHTSVGCPEGNATKSRQEAPFAFVVSRQVVEGFLKYCFCFAKL
jgi:hypothetical protein